MKSKASGMPAGQKPDDPRAFFALRLVCFSAAAGVGLVLVADALSGFSKNFPATVVMFSVVALCAAMSCFRALYRVTATLFPAAVLALLILLFVTGNGIHDPASPAFLVVVLIAAFFLGKRGALLFTGLSLFSSGLVICAEILGIVHSPNHTTWGTLVTFSAVTGVGGVLLWLLLGELERRALHETEEAAEIRVLNEKLQRRVEEKDLLLRELQHRIKNNLQQLASLMSIGTVGEESAESVRRAAERRIQAMADFYDLCLNGDQLSEIPLGLYLETVCRSALYQRGGAPLNLEIDQEARATMNKALLSGLLVAELVSTPFFEYPVLQAEANVVADAAPTGVRLSVRTVALGAQAGIEISYPPSSIGTFFTSSGLGLLGILEDELGAAVSIDLDERRISSSFLLLKDEAERQA
jgi:hypothetical protein